MISRNGIGFIAQPRDKVCSNPMLRQTLRRRVRLSINRYVEAISFDGDVRFFIQLTAMGSKPYFTGI